MKAVTRHRAVIVLALSVSLLLGVAQPAAELPRELSSEEFWRLVSEFSEPDGNFHSDNFVSNERSFQHVLDDLGRDRQPGSAYLGVGPEQNFTYLLAVKPRIAFIVDIRRQNLIEHLMFKAIFELSSDRAEFLSRLFSRPRPAEIPSSSVKALFAAFRPLEPSPSLQQENLHAIKNRLMVHHGFSLSASDERALEYVHAMFLTIGPSLTYDGPRYGLTGVMPTFEELMIATDLEGQHRSFLATEDNFKEIQELHRKNLLVPIVGDFAGPKALRSVGRYLGDHNATVSAFYTSNVEQYLFMSGDAWERYYTNVSTLPVDDRSVFVRGVIRSEAGELSSSPALPPSSHYETRLFHINDLLAAFKSGSIHTYYDILR